MSLLQAGSRSWIGLDIDAAWFRAAQLRPTKDGWRIEALTSVPRDEIDAPVTCREAAVVRSVLERQGFVGRSVVLGAPHDSTFCGVLDLPPLESGAPLPQIARMELARMHHVRPDELEMSFWPVLGAQREKDNAQVFAVGMRHRDANTLLDCFENVGLDVKAIDAHTVAVGRACRAAAAGGPDVVAVLDTSWREGWLSILYRGQIVYERCLPSAGLKHLAEAIQVRLGLDLEMATKLLATPAEPQEDPEAGEPLIEPLRDVIKSHLEAMVPEIEAPFSYVRHRNPDAHVGRLILLGARDVMGLAGRLAEALHVDVQTVHPSDLAASTNRTRGKDDDPGLTLAVALAQFSDRRAA